MKNFVFEYHTIKAGENSADNWKLLDATENEDCYVFHLSHYPSGYVILSGEITTKGIYDAAVICKSRTKYLRVPRLVVDYSHRSNVKKGDVVGELIWISRRKVSNVIV
jgi:hypothetical protein